MPEARITRLEEQLYFQEQQLEQLNEALIEQQKYISMLENRLTLAEEKLRLLEAQADTKIANTLPPHFMPERY